MIIWTPRRIAGVCQSVAMEDVEAGEFIAGWRLENVAEALVEARIIQPRRQDRFCRRAQV
jgi:hypothetical protein